VTRYKGRQSAKAVEKDFPHFVDTVVPLGGLGNTLDAMYEFHTRHGIRPQRGQGRHDANGSVIRWCFADLAIAEAFASEFKRLCTI
jgi:hypothetical protein